MKLRTSKKTIFVHPNGYFEVVEISGVNLMGDTFRYREAFTLRIATGGKWLVRKIYRTILHAWGIWNPVIANPCKAYRLNCRRAEAYLQYVSKRYEHCKYCSTDGLQCADRSERNQRPARAENGSDVVGS